MNDCIFCKIIKGDIPSTKIIETDTVFAFLDARPLHAGHTLVIPKEHHESIIDIPTNILQDVIAVAQKVARAIKLSLPADGVNVSQNNGKAAGQVVYHLHFHVIPRYANDGYKHWSRENPVGEKDEDIAEKIKKALA
jgi:histidine triad (HIT) family protein